MCDFSAYVAFDKATNGQTDTKHEMGETISWMSVLKMVGEKLPPSQRSSLEKQITSQSFHYYSSRHLAVFVWGGFGEMK